MTSTGTQPRRGRTPLRAVIEHAPPMEAPPPIAWRPFMSAYEVARITGISYPTLLKWLDEEREECGCALRDRVCVRAIGNVWIKTDAFRRWMAGELFCRHVYAAALAEALHPVGAAGHQLSGDDDG